MSVNLKIFFKGVGCYYLYNENSFYPVMMLCFDYLNGSYWFCRHSSIYTLHKTSGTNMFIKSVKPLEIDS